MHNLPNPRTTTPFVPDIWIKPKPRWSQNALSAEIQPVHTPPANAKPPLSPMVNHATFNKPPLPNLAKTKTVINTVSHGTVSRDANQDLVALMASTYVPCAALVPTTPNTAPLYNFCRIVTPFIPDAWDKALHVSGLLSRFHDVPCSIRNGFDMGTSSTPLKTYVPSNHSSSLTHPEEIQSYIHTELSLGRYTGPFSRSKLEQLIGPFRTSPLGVVPKPGTDNFRLVQDFSYPHDNPLIPSINSEINLDDFRCDWVLFNKL